MKKGFKTKRNKEEIKSLYFSTVGLTAWQNIKWCSVQPVFMPTTEDRLAGCLGAMTGWPSRGQRCDAGSRRWQLSVTLHTGCHLSRLGERKREMRQGKGESGQGDKKVRALSQSVCMFLFSYLSEDRFELQTIGARTLSHLYIFTPLQRSIWF